MINLRLTQSERDAISTKTERLSISMASYLKMVTLNATATKAPKTETTAEKATNFNFRITDEEKAIIKIKADTLNTTVSAYIKHIAMNATVRIELA